MDVLSRREALRHKGMMEERRDQSREGAEARTEWVRERSLEALGGVPRAARVSNLSVPRRVLALIRRRAHTIARSREG